MTMEEHTGKIRSGGKPARGAVQHAASLSRDLSHLEKRERSRGKAPQNLSLRTRL